MTEDVKRGEIREKEPAWIQAGGEDTVLKCEARWSDVRFWGFHLSSLVSALSLEPGLFIRGWGKSWIPQCEIGSDANPDRLVIKKPLEEEETEQEGRGEKVCFLPHTLIFLSCLEHIVRLLDATHCFILTYDLLWP